MPRRVYVAEVEIDAPASSGWAVLAGVATYQAWNPFTPECVTSLEVGQPVDMRVRMAKLGFSVQQRETVRVELFGPFWKNNISNNFQVCSEASL